MQVIHQEERVGGKEIITFHTSDPMWMGAKNGYWKIDECVAKLTTSCFAWSEKVSVPKGRCKAYLLVILIKDMCPPQRTVTCFLRFPFSKVCVNKIFGQGQRFHAGFQLTYVPEANY